MLTEALVLENCRVQLSDGREALVDVRLERIEQTPRGTLWLMGRAVGTNAPVQLNIAMPVWEPPGGSDISVWRRQE